MLTHGCSALTNTPPAAPGSNTTSAWNTAANAVGCGTTAGDAQFACMKSVPFDTLKDVLIADELDFSLVADGTYILSQPVIPPLINHDPKVSPSSLTLQTAVRLETFSRYLCLQERTPTKAISSFS